MTRAEAVAKTVTALLSDEVETAATIASNFHGGAGSLYENESVNIVRFILDHDYTPDPNITPDVLTPLRVVAAAMELWGEVNIDEIADVRGSWTYKYNPEIVTHLLYTAGLEQHRRQRLRDMGIQEVEARSNQETGLCPTCQADLGQAFPIDEAPFLPHRTCSCENSCHCSYIARRADEKREQP
jgi:hypothetical protein